ncbi:hypothetical protein [Mucilaginibacter lacusdianchii]|uniref:hypothetical protein n=1 Tax=Mucilaginibacter lacusdianchii TaxID=2684211 RepID=UPI00131C7AD1|nr:hypothetical protein [Mucilaginibacter sp. JXJ CY 39]
MKKLLSLALIVLAFSSCTENYSNGERIGVITQLSRTGVFWKSYEGHLNVTQTGMNSSVPFDFSIDNDHEDTAVINTLTKAAENGWKVKLIYHETQGKNFFNNRGQTDHFINKVEVLDKNMATLFSNKNQAPVGHVIDTIYVVIDKSQLKKK